MYKKSRTRGYYRSKSRSNSLKRSFTATITKSSNISKVRSPTLVHTSAPGFVDDFFLFKPDKLCMNIIKSPFSRFPEKLFAFQVILSRKNFKFTQSLQKQLFDWTEHFIHKKKFLVLLTLLLKTQLDFFENCEVNRLVKMVSKCCLRKIIEKNLSANYKKALFSFFLTVVQLPVKIWTGSFLKVILICFTQKRAIKLLLCILNSPLEKIYSLQLEKLASEKELSRTVLGILKELIFIKGKSKLTKETGKNFLKIVYEASKLSENAPIVNETLKFLEEFKNYDLDQGLLISIKLNMS